MSIKDSGNRTDFPSGAVRDIQTGKGRCDLMPLDVVGMCYDMMGDPSGSSLIFHELHMFTMTGNDTFLVRALNVFSANYDGYAGMFLEVAKHFEEGAEKYGENNWQKGLPVKSFINSGIRHYLKVLRGDTDEPHDRAFVWNIMCAIWTCKHHPGLNEYKRDKEWIEFQKDGDDDV